MSVLSRHWIPDKGNNDGILAEITVTFMISIDKPLHHHRQALWQEIELKVETKIEIECDIEIGIEGLTGVGTRSGTQIENERNRHSERNQHRKRSGS
ncbi:hypothetical protein EVAR_32506_1 [Eumeta japonica]|uniref:Uncharacterized protein n=1 Tax=Eumeta variegata TaxID=151549 RepID=A0A4C1WA16_EUMVA|nr:hypothetical protein EVAR_32506_1 [Eumeta japonica]